jgi:hypothetical protein
MRDHRQVLKAASLISALTVVSRVLGYIRDSCIAPIDKSSNLRQGWMHFLDLAPHLLRDESIIRMALRHRSQLAHVYGLAQIHFHIPADLVSEGDNVLRFAGQIDG